MKIACLTHLYTRTGLLRDGDGDGLPDGFGLRFIVGQTPGAIDVAARLGLECAAWTPGFTQPSAEGLPVWFGPENPSCPLLQIPPGCGVVALAHGGLVISGESARAGWDAARWLAHTYPFAAPGGPLLADMAGGRPIRSLYLRDGAVIHLEYGEAMDVNEVERPADLCTGTGSDEKPPFAAQAPGDLPPAGAGRLFTVGGLMGSSDSARHDQAGWQVRVNADTAPEEIAALCELAARTGVEATGMRFPLAVEDEPVGRAVRLLEQAPEAVAWIEGCLAWADGALIAFGSPHERAEALQKAAANAGLVNGLHATLFTAPTVHAAEPSHQGTPLFDIVMEQEWEVDRFWRAWKERVLPVLGSGAVRVDLRLSEPLALREALAEEIARSLAESSIPAAHIRVLSAYKQGFYWLEEEILPRLMEFDSIADVVVTCTPFMPEGALELKIRWLQELYPADELLAQALGVSVRFDLAAAPQPHTYQVTAWSADKRPLFTEGFSPVYAVRPYMPEFLERGRVHPPTGLLRVEQNGQLLAEMALDTDAEAFWTAYQEQVLPHLRRALIQTYGATPEPDAQPFFGALLIEVALSEDDRPLPIRQERISPLDAMHEDLYFYTLDYLQELGRSLIGSAYLAPGAVEPWVIGRAGAPRARVRLFGRPMEQQVVSGTLPERVEPLPPPASAIPTDEIIGPAQLPAYLAYLAALPGVRVWQAGRSFGGRPIWALSVVAPTAGAIAPPQKLSAWRPTLLLNARRHANEVSSTNSALKLAEMLATNPRLRNRLNLVINPMENVDGAALHHAMQQIHPTWKLHAARFNAAGVDLGTECFAREPRYGESRVLPTLWRASLPDVVLDDHGYPSHEWVQPFSGYNSPPYFKTSWWIPSALIYTIFRWLDDERFPHNGAVQSGLREALADRLGNDPEIAAYSRILLDRYIAYGQRHLPEKFPLEMHREVMSLRWSTAAGPEARTFSGRFPQITAAELVTEVPDETAQSEYLSHCVHAHLAADTAVLDFLAAYPQPVMRRRTVIDGRVHWTIGRERPLRISTDLRL